MNGPSKQDELFGVIFQPFRKVFRLRAGDVFRSQGRLRRVIRVNECAAVILMNRLVREFTTRFDKRVRFQPTPLVFRISPNAEVEILNRKVRKQTKSNSPDSRCGESPTERSSHENLRRQAVLRPMFCDR